MRWNEVQLIEINEAFAVQVLAAELVLRKEFGHGNQPRPAQRQRRGDRAGASGRGERARLVLTLLKEMKRRNLKTGIVSACVGGGQGGALILERA